MADEIAIVGLDVRYSGCKTQDEFWKIVKNGEVTIAPISEKRYHQSINSMSKQIGVLTQSVVLLESQI